MTLMGSSDVGSLCLAVYFMSVFSTCSMKQCELQKLDKLQPSSVTIRNIGIKLCQVRCNEKSGCLSVEYNHETLTCRLSGDEAKKIKKREGYIVQSKDHASVQAGPCASKSPSLNSRCLETRSGKSVCVDVHVDAAATPTPQRRDPQADSDLFKAIRSESIENVSRVLAAGRADINSRNRDGETPVMRAALTGHMNVVKLLVSEGANVRLLDRNCNSILYWAIGGTDVETVKFVLSLNVVDINIRGEDGWTPVMAAAYDGNTELMELLVSKGADVTLVSDEGDNILHLACTSGDMEVVEFVLSLNVVDIDARNDEGRTAADEARYHTYNQIADLVESRGAQ